MIRNPSKRTAYNDGVVKLYTAENVAASGKMPVLHLTFLCQLWFDEMTVGITRYYTAKQANAEIETVLRCPRWRDISTQLVAQLADGKIYRIEQIQYPRDAVPASMDLALSRIEQRFEVVAGGDADGEA